MHVPSDLCRSFGAVYRATHLGTGETVALKKVMTDDMVDSFKEIAIMREIDCDNLVRFFGSYEFDGFLWVTQYISRPVQKLMSQLVDRHGVLRSRCPHRHGSACGSCQVKRAASCIRCKSHASRISVYAQQRHDT